jgi:hypothetical protein
MPQQMNNNKLTIEINKPLAEVFTFCITPPKAKLWVPGIVNETTNEWPAKVGTVYTEYKNNTNSFNIIVIDYKDNEYIEWKTENGKYHVRYTFTAIDQNTTQLEYVETGDVAKPFTLDVLEILKQVVEDR